VNGQNFHQLRFYQEQLFETKNKLFNAKNIKQVKFLQDRISFLVKNIEKIENNGK